MDDLRLMLILVGSFAIIAVLIHGFWMNKKENSSIFDGKSDKKSKKTVGQPLDEEHEKMIMQTPFDDLYPETEPDSAQESPKIAEKTPHLDESLYTTETQTPSISAHKTDDFDTTSVTLSPKESPTTEDVEQKITETDYPAINESAEENATVTATEPEAPAANVNEKPKEKINDIIVLHIVSMYDEFLKGAQLYPSLLNTGFRFGEMDIFHRYADNDIDGKVLFSLANMVKPGTLQPESMPYLETPGVTVFMPVPTPGDSMQSFKLMLQCVQKIADQVDGRILDEQRHMLTPQKIDAYKERIRHVMKHNDQISATH